MIVTANITKGLGVIMNKEERLKIFGENLQKARERTGMGKPAAAEKMGIQSAQYYRYEAGRAEPGILMTVDIANKLQVPVTELLQGIEEDISKTEYIVNKLRSYGIHAETIEGDSEHIMVRINDFRPSKESVGFMEAVLSAADETAKETLKKAVPAAYAKMLFETIDKDALGKHLQDAFAALKNSPDDK